MSTETIRLIKDGGRGGGMEAGEEGDIYIPTATLSPPVGGGDSSVVRAPDS